MATGINNATVRGVLAAPFPYPGGKTSVAEMVWDALGDVQNYLEPFAGSLAVLLGRPTTHSNSTETVSDLNGYIANFWRAVRAEPDAVAAWADYPTSHVDQFARHWWLLERNQELVDLLASDPEVYDAKIAGWWVWGISTWIGTGWCERGSAQRPHLGNDGKGVQAKRPHLGNDGQGVQAQRPHLGNDGKGVQAKRPHLGNDGKWIYPYMRRLAKRLERVRIIHGDWSRLTRGALKYGATKGIFLDPPYDKRTLAAQSDLYAGHHDNAVSAQVRDWAISIGDDPQYRIVLAGYEEEHADHMPDNWHTVTWSSPGMQTTKHSGSNLTRHNERLWFSPHCLIAQQQTLI